MMEIREAQVRQRQLEADILSLIANFEEETRLHVSTIYTTDISRADGKTLVSLVRLQVNF